MIEAFTLPSARFLQLTRSRLAACTRTKCIAVRYLSTKLQDTRQRRVSLFEEEKQRQSSQKIEKIKVELVQPVPLGETEKPLILLMNKHKSTPYDCAKHVSKMLLDSAALARVTPSSGDDCKHVDMHEPLTEDCDLKLLGFHDGDSSIAHTVNKAFWRSCSFVLGAVLETAFKDSNRVALHSWPGADYASGSFVYDVKIDGLDNWTPSNTELDILSRHAVMRVLGTRALFEPLEVSQEIAANMFADNQFKSKQLDSIAEKSGKIRVYRLGDHVDITGGPLISHSQQIGHFSIVKVTRLEEGGGLYRFQGVALPAQQRVSSYTWDVLKKAAKRPNRMVTPGQPRLVHQHEPEQSKMELNR
uniref:39S ribosomal protein L39, mitochondrial n=1 Tax=Plectus sambesii TaxID=2011161 RepID=A0A914VDR2_9BILA